MIEDFARVLRDRMREDAETERMSLARGVAKDFAGYQYACGIVRGLELAEQHVIDLLSAAREADEL